MRALHLAAAAALLASTLPGVGHAQSAVQAYTANVLQGEPDNIDPNRSSFTTEAAVIRQVFEPLLRLDRSLRAVPAAAESYDVSPDGTVYTFHLRPDGKFSDGTPVTAQNFEYSFKRILDPKIASDYASFFVDAGIIGADDWNAGRTATADNVGVRAVDDLTLEIRLREAFAPFPDLVALWVVSPVRQDIIEANGDHWAQDPATYIGNGPFVLTEWLHQDHISFAPNPNYHGPGPFLQQMTFLMITDLTVDYAAYLNGERDEALVPDPAVQAVRNDPQLAQELTDYTDLSTFWLYLNTAKAPLKDPLVHRALSKAIDRQALIRDVAGGVGQPATSIIPPGMPGFREGLGSDIGFDPQGARDLLAQAGFAGGARFPTLSFSFATSSEAQRRAEFIQAQFKQNLGITIQLDPMEAKAYQAAFKAQSYDIAFGGWEADYPDPQDWFNTNFGCKGGNNKLGYCNPTFDQLVAHADTALDFDERMGLYEQAQQLLLQDAPVVPLYNRGRLVLTKPYLQNLTITAQDDFPGDLFLDEVTVAAH